MFEDLISDPAAISAFATRENARSEAALMDAAFEADVAEAERILGSEASLGGLIRRGAWIYTFRTTGAHPRGVWLRRPDDGVVEAETGWDVVFDLDAYCAETGEDWHWRGAPTCPDNPERVLICLSQGGSDQRIAREYDCGVGAFVEGGFTLGPERGHVTWLDADTVLWSSALEGDATDSSWPGAVRRLRRGQALAEAEEIFRAAPGDLLASGYYVPDGQGGRLTCVTRVIAIGEQEVTLLRADGPFKLPAPTDTSVTHSATHYAYVVKGQGGPVGALMLGEVGAGGARVVMQAEARQSIESVDVLDDWLVWMLRDNMVPRLFALALGEADATPVEIPFPVAADSAFLGGHSTGDDSDETLQLNLQGFLTPPRVYTFDLEDGPDGITWNLIWAEPEEFDATGLTVQLLEATSDDGTQVPYHLVLPADAPPDLPVLLYGYGGFNVSLAPYYPAMRGALWLSKGYGFAQAYIRGGGELGPAWHKAAKRENRPRAFEDFAAVASDMVARGVTTPARVACNGGSNGGLLTGVMLTRYPERFGAVWTSVGVHDMLGFHSFPAGRGWIDEYGDPDDPEMAKTLRGYSPLHNVAPAAEGAYPPVFVETSDFDDRVDPSHSRRFAARLREAGQDALYVEHKGGHGGSSSVHDRAKNAALGYSFLRRALGL
ncbi:prolyl oligopeptidase family serine peptidase [Candidatus Rhodobacter oscarellae]|nr:prolyl oligopeptidase family serine peptidase [Candidatus Rhodobacter lobularis]